MARLEKELIYQLREHFNTDRRCEYEEDDADVTLSNGMFAQMKWRVWSFDYIQDEPEPEVGLPYGEIRNLTANGKLRECIVDQWDYEADKWNLYQLDPKQFDALDRIFGECLD